MDSLEVLDPEGPIREADIGSLPQRVRKLPIAVGDPQVTFKANCGARIGRPSDKPSCELLAHPDQDANSIQRSAEADP